MYIIYNALFVSVEKERSAKEKHVEKPCPRRRPLTGLYVSMFDLASFGKNAEQR